MFVVWLADVIAMVADVIATSIYSVLADVIVMVVDVITTTGVYIVWQILCHMCGNNISHHGNNISQYILVKIVVLTSTTDNKLAITSANVG